MWDIEIRFFQWRRSPAFQIKLQCHCKYHKGGRTYPSEGPDGRADPGVGANVGAFDGFADGVKEGKWDDGLLDGATDGISEGSVDGIRDGTVVGTWEGSRMTSLSSVTLEIDSISSNNTDSVLTSTNVSENATSNSSTVGGRLITTPNAGQKQSSSTFT